MNFSRKDMSILVAMVIALALISFIMPAIAPDEKLDEPPEFEIDADRFDFGGEFPTQPGAGKETTIELNSSDAATSSSRIWADYWYNGSDINKDTLDIGAEVTDSNGNRQNIGETRLEERGDADTFIDDKVHTDSEVTVSLQEVERGEDYATYTVKASVVYQDSGLVSVLSNIVNVLIWGLGTIVSIFTNTFGIIFDVITYVFGLVNYVTSTYGTVISYTPGWASFILAIPGLLTAYILLKIVLVAVSILWVG